MSGPVMLVTGGSRGIGAAVACLAASRGWTVAVNYVRDEGAANGVVAAIEADGGEAFAVRGNVGTETDVLAMFRAVDRVGPLKALVNNAGIVDRVGRLDTFTLERIERMFRVNVLGSMLCAREAVRRMSTAHGGAGGVIVNVSSAAAKFGGPDQYVDYASAKGAIDTMTVGLAKEVIREGIRVCAVRPGIIETEIHASGGQPNRVAEAGPNLPMGRAGTPEEVARAILWLVSDEASYSSGAILDVSGARSIWP